MASLFAIEGARGDSDDVVLIVSYLYYLLHCVFVCLVFSLSFLCASKATPRWLLNASLFLVIVSFFCLVSLFFNKSWVIIHSCSFEAI